MWTPEGEGCWGAVSPASPEQPHCILFEAPGVSRMGVLRGPFSVGNENKAYRRTRLCWATFWGGGGSAGAGDDGMLEIHLSSGPCPLHLRRQQQMEVVPSAAPAPAGPGTQGSPSRQGEAARP